MRLNDEQKKSTNTAILNALLAALPGSSLRSSDWFQRVETEAFYFEVQIKENWETGTSFRVVGHLTKTYMSGPKPYFIVRSSDQVAAKLPKILGQLQSMIDRNAAQKKLEQEEMNRFRSFAKSTAELFGGSNLPLERPNDYSMDYEMKLAGNRTARLKEHSGHYSVEIDYQTPEQAIEIAKALLLAFGPEVKQ